MSFRSMTTTGTERRFDAQLLKRFERPCRVLSCTLLNRIREESKEMTSAEATQNNALGNGEASTRMAAALATNDDAAAVAKLRQARTRVRDEMAKVVVGQDDIIEAMIVGLLSRGHVLLHGVPGLG